MFQIDNPSAATTYPTKKPTGAPGYFTVGSLGGVPATIVEADWLNIVQAELLNILSAAAIAPSKSDDTQVITAILALIAQNTRRRLTGALDLYVSPTGNDANDGLTPSTPFATPQAAWNFVIARLDCGGQTITTHLANGSYPPLYANGVPVGAGAGGIVFVGNTANPLSVTISSSAANTHAVAVTSGANITLHGINLTTTGATSGNCLYCWGADCFYENINFSASSNGSHVVADEGALVTLTGPYTINGGAANHLASAHGGLVSINIFAGINPGTLATVTVTGTPTFASGFAAVSGGGSIGVIYAQARFVGAAHGPRYSASYNGSILTAGGTINFYPGDVAGTVDATTYGTYQP